MNKIVESLHRSITSARYEKERLYETMLNHSEEYKEALELAPDDVKELEDMQRRTGMYPSSKDMAEQGFLTFEVKGEEFAFYVKNVCGCPYGGEWSIEILTTCISNSSLNTETGGGTTLIGVIPEDYHKALLEKIKESPKLLPS